MKPVAPSCEEGDGEVSHRHVTHFFNTTIHKALRRGLRNEMTGPEKAIWLLLRGDQIGFRFRRQYGVGRYIIDFYCPVLRVAVELDGDSHGSVAAQEYDRIRNVELASMGILTLRFSNGDVCQNPEGVMERIIEICRQRSVRLPPAPSSQEGENA